MFFIFLTSGLFLGWSLGANDAANVFGTAVGTKMIRFRTAALLCSIFVILGATFGGQGTTDMLNGLGSVDTIAGAFTVALVAAFTVFIMTKAGLPVSTSQSIVGAIIGWNLFIGYQTETASLLKILSSWIICPLLAAFFAILLYIPIKALLLRSSLHLLTRDVIVRWGLIISGSFGAYSLGANNIANVMGVFVNSSKLTEFDFFGIWIVSPTLQLFALGGLAIALGVFTYSEKVIKTVGQGIFKLSPEIALVVVLSQSLVLFLFSSETLEYWLLSHHLPALPLVPVSSTQAVVGAIAGIAIFKGSRGIKFNKLGMISAGWVVTPVLAIVLTFFSLFVMKNVFDQEVNQSYTYRINAEVLSQLDRKDIGTAFLIPLINAEYSDIKTLNGILREEYHRAEIKEITDMSRIRNIFIDPEKFGYLQKQGILSEEQLYTLQKIASKSFEYEWQFKAELENLSPEWKKKSSDKINKKYNKDLEGKMNYLILTFKVNE